MNVMTFTPSLFIILKKGGMWIRKLQTIFYIFPFGPCSYIYTVFLALSPLLLLSSFSVSWLTLRTIFSAMLTIALASWLFGTFTCFLPPVVKRYNVNLEARYGNGRALRVLHLSDLHMGPSVPRFYQRQAFVRALSVIEQLAVDVVVVTGDLSDGDDATFYRGASFLRQFAEACQKQDKPVPVFLVDGNHDLLDFGEFSAACAPAQFIGETATTDFAIVDDVIIRGTLSKDEDTQAIRLAPLDTSFPNRPTIFLQHVPRPVLGNRPDLVLAGHTHGGQLWTQAIITVLMWTFHVGQYVQDVDGTVSRPTRVRKRQRQRKNKYDHPMHYIVNAGTNWWGPPLRNMRREIGLITVRH
eukprot:gnl/Chilomastix_cuspidata/2518.p1 GENE.gnl/Chilomastix_cuspidata/2518~~gnl/Chilomastix_cuspidata/2518.p1  ORF type:complete len:406 (-),score=74.32 gnl/Chilomastix_cuspidata/2518:128-1192(-)